MFEDSGDIEDRDKTIASLLDSVGADHEIAKYQGVSYEQLLGIFERCKTAAEMMNLHSTMGMLDKMEAMQDLLDKTIPYYHGEKSPSQSSNPFEQLSRDVSLAVVRLRQSMKENGFGEYPQADLVAAEEELTNMKSVVELFISKVQAELEERAQ